MEENFIKEKSIDVQNVHIYLTDIKFIHTSVNIVKQSLEEGKTEI